MSADPQTPEPQRASFGFAGSPSRAGYGDRQTLFSGRCLFWLMKSRKQSPKWGQIPHILRILLRIKGKTVAESVADGFFVAESAVAASASLPATSQPCAHKNRDGGGMEYTKSDFCFRFSPPYMI